MSDQVTHEDVQELIRAIRQLTQAVDALARQQMQAAPGLVVGGAGWPTQLT